MDLDRDAQRILDLATEARAPAAADKARVEQKLAAMLGVGVLAGAPAVASEAAAHGASTALAGVKAASGTALKWWIAAAAIAGAAAGYVALSSESEAAPREPNAPAKVERPIVAPPVVHAAPQLEAPAPIAPEPPARVASTRKRSPAPSTLSEELELLHRAQAAWRAHDAAQASELLDQHRLRFPRSELRLERDGLRVLTLCELGKKAEAGALARKLLERAPRSPLRATIEESCALK